MSITRYSRSRKGTSEQEMKLYKKFSNLHMPLIACITILSFIGFAMLYSAARGDFEPWAIKQIVRFAFIFPIMILIAVTDIKIWFRLAYFFYGFGIVLLIIVDIVGYLGKGAQRWVDLGPINLQPSELMKVFLIMALARYFHNTHVSEVDSIHKLLTPLAMIGVPAILILGQPNLGTATITFATGVAILFATGVGWKKFIIAGLGGLSLLPIAWQFLHDYQKRRVMTFLDPDADPLGSGYNIIQSKIAIGSGGLTGKGFMQGSQSQLNFLPEKQTDFIFPIMAEEFGLIGGLLVIFVFGLIMFYGIRIALNSNNHFGRMMATGVTFLLFIHVFINMAMVMGLIPVVGVPLPFLSYGGSIMISMMLCMGFLLNAHIHREFEVGNPNL